MKLAFTIFLFVISQSIFAQINAITETGQEVILKPDSTWTYKNNLEEEVKVIPKNEAIFEKEAENSFLVKSKVFDIGVWINPKEWSFEKSTLNQYAEYQFVKKSLNSWAMLITEPVTIELEMLGDIAYANAKSGAQGLTKDLEEYRTVNGEEILCIKMSGIVQGVDLTYIGYYYSNEKGTVQLLTWCYSQEFEKLKEDNLKFLNGLVVLKE